MMSTNQGSHQLYPFLKQFKQLNLKEITIQTDNGNEFTNRYKRTKGQDPIKSSFTLFIEDKFKRHKTNIPSHPTSDSDIESFHWSIERDCLAWDDIVDDETLIKYTTDYMKEYLQSEIKTRGYSPIEKIKETYDMTNIVYPMPQIINLQFSQTTFNIIHKFFKNLNIKNSLVLSYKKEHKQTFPGFFDYFLIHIRK